MVCYTCGKQSTTNICAPCQKQHGLNQVPIENDFDEDEPNTQPLFDLSDFEDKDFAADEDGAVIKVDRWNLLEGLYDECRRLREDGTRTKNGYTFSDKELTDLFVILDALETI